MHPIPVLTPQQSNAWDAQAEAGGIARATLMAEAGRAVVAVVAARFPLALSRGVLVAVGPGNNGGDGWVVARVLHRAGIPVWVAAVAGDRSDLCAAAARQAQREGVREVPPDGPWPSIGIAIDALLGTGARGAPRAPIATLVERMTDLSVPIVAVDGPTGVDLATGVVHGLGGAQVTVTFGGIRRGHLLARDEVGDVVIADVGHPPPAAEWPWLMRDADAAAHVTAFSASAHKGTRGRLVVVGGAPGMAGAVRMAARAAFAGGAGLVHVVAPEATLDVLHVAEPDVQTLAQDFDSPARSETLELIGRADALVLGPGFGRAENRTELALRLISSASAVVLDADGLVAFHRRIDDLRAALAGRTAVLTPHPGEFRTLFPALAAGAEADPWGAASEAADLLGATILLKGVPSVVASPGRATVTIGAGNPGLATGGSGDLLSGLIGVLLAHGVDAQTAAAVGAHALGRAADIAARRHTVRAMRPVDVVAALPDLWREWQLLRRAPPLLRPPILLELPAPPRG